jgi:sirohydrochlorin cobaltochelatase
VSEPSLEQLLESELASGSFTIGEVAIEALNDGTFDITHCDAETTAAAFAPDEALEIAKFDDAGNYRPLRTAPTLRHGWKIIVSTISEAANVIEAIYPARLAAWHAWKLGRLATTPLRQTLNRQSGMYRVAAKISDDQINELVGNFCRSDGGCLRAILWRRDYTGAIASTKLPVEKFDPAFDQTGGRKKCVPLLCQEACNLLVAACREAVKGSGTR